MGYICARAITPAASLNTRVQVRWKVTTQTSNIFGAGTDAKVWVQLHGPNGMLNGAEISLDNSSNNFERGALDQFFFEFPADKDCGTPLSKASYLGPVQASNHTPWGSGIEGNGSSMAVATCSPQLRGMAALLVPR